MKKLFCVISVFIFSLKCLANVERIESTRFDKGQVKRIYLAPGLGSIVLFPCAIAEVFVGRSEDLKSQISANDKKSLYLNLKLNASLPTNMIVKCDTDQNIFVFDVIPSRSKHQDLVEIRTSYGGPGRKKLLSFSKSDSTNMQKRLIIEKATLVSQGVNK